MIRIIGSDLIDTYSISFLSRDGAPIYNARFQNSIKRLDTDLYDDDDRFRPEYPIVPSSLITLV